MGFFKDILKEAVIGNLENKINDVLNSHTAVKINYDSQTKEDTASGERIIYPTAYGLSTAGNPVIRAYQEGGATASIKPAWKLFRLDGITNWRETNERFTTRDLPGLKLEPDLQMSIEYNSAFGGDTEPKTMDSTPVTKQELKPNKIEKTNNLAPTQNNPIGGNKTIDNIGKTSDIPSGINPETQEAPQPEPIKKTDFGSQETSVPSDKNLPSGPITHDNFAPETETPKEVQDTEETEDGEIKPEDEDLYNEVEKVNNLMERINNLYKR